MREVVNKMSMTVVSKSVNESFVRSTIAVFMSQLDPTVEELSDLKTAISEAVTNCIVHGYKNTVGNIYISSNIVNESKKNGEIVHSIEVKIRDKGCGIEDIKKAREPLFTTSNDEQAGLGFSVMESFTDKIKVTSKPGKGTSVTLIKYIKSR